MVWVEDFAQQLLAPLFADEAKHGDADAVARALEDDEYVQSRAQDASFKTQVFWLTAYAIHVLVLPVMKLAQAFVQAAGHFQAKGEMDIFTDCYGEYLCFDVALRDPAHLERLGHALNLVLGVLCVAAFGTVPSGRTPIPPPTLSPRYTVLPAMMLEDVFEALNLYEEDPSGRQKNPLLPLLEPTLFLPILLLTLASDDYAKNPMIRGKAAQLMKALLKDAAYARRITDDDLCVQNLVPALVCVFAAVEKTKQSYFDIRFQIKYDLRVHILELFEALLPLPRTASALSTTRRTVPTSSPSSSTCC